MIFGRRPKSGNMVNTRDAGVNNQEEKNHVLKGGLMEELKERHFYLFLGLGGSTQESSYQPS